MNWAIYDMTADDIIGLWPRYEDCIKFCVENQDMQNDCWEIFPEFECILPVGA